MAPSIFVQKCLSLAKQPYKVFVRSVTLPYYRYYFINTVYPFDAMEAAADNPENFLILFHRWRGRKLAEFQFTSIACTILAAAVIGSFSWNNVKDAYWLASAFWYCSLVLSLLGILLSAQQASAIEHLGKPNLDSANEAKEAHRYMPLILSPMDSTRNKWVLKRRMIFVWQCPIMFMSYSVWTFVCGMTLYVTTPLIRREWDHWTVGVNIAIAYLGTVAVAGSMFVYCSFWIYHNVDLQGEATDLLMMAEHSSVIHLQTNRP